MKDDELIIKILLDIKQHPNEIILPGNLRERISDEIETTRYEYLVRKLLEKGIVKLNKRYRDHLGIQYQHEVDLYLNSNMNETDNFDETEIKQSILKLAYESKNISVTELESRLGYSREICYSYSKEISTDGYVDFANASTRGSKEAFLDINGKGEVFYANGGYSDAELESNSSMVDSKDIFIVHGHNNEVKIDVARTLDHLGLNPIILHEKPNQGKTIIEKFEMFSNVGYAVVLLTADDTGKSESANQYNARARQNVILELGFFLGRLGRSKVCSLYEVGVELPTDLDGILWVELDVSGGWKTKLIRELQAAGYPVDANHIL